MTKITAKLGPAGMIFAALAAIHSTNASAQAGLIGEYYNQGAGASPAPPQGSPAGGATALPIVTTRTDANINFGFATPNPAPNINADGFMVAWTGDITITMAGTYIFRVNSDDGCRMWLDGNATPIINSWIDQGPTDHDSAGMALAAGPHEIRIEFYENGGGEACVFSYNGPDSGNAMMIVPGSVLTVPQPPGAASGLTGNGTANVNTGAAQVVLNWTAGANATSYRVQRSNAMGGPFTTIATVTGLTYTDTGVIPTQTYFYQIIAVRGSLAAGPSNIIQVTAQSPPPKTTTSAGNNNNLGHRCGCSSIGDLGSEALLAAMGILAMAALFAKRSGSTRVMKG